MTGSFTLNLLLRVKNLPHAMTMLLLMMTTMIMLRIVFKRKLFVLVSAVVFVVAGALHAWMKHRDIVIRYFAFASSSRQRSKARLANG